MDNNNGRAAQVHVQISGGDVVDWRTQLSAYARNSTVNRIMKTWKVITRREAGLQELENACVRFEQKIYTEATSQRDYLRQISLKMLGMEMQSQIPIPNSLQLNAASNSRNPQDSDPVVINPEQHSNNLSCASTANETKLARNLLRTVVQRWRRGEKELMEDYLTIENAYKALGGDSDNDDAPSSSSCRDEYGVEDDAI